MKWPLVMPQHDSLKGRGLEGAPSPRAAIAGPRRAQAPRAEGAAPTRTTPPPLPSSATRTPAAAIAPRDLSVKIASAPGAAAIAAPARIVAARPELPSLDYENMPSVRTPAPARVIVSAAQETTARIPRRCPKRLHWFAIGLILGTVAAIASTGDVRGKLRELRAELALTIRSFKRHPLPVKRAPMPAETALASTQGLSNGPPCTEDDCALLLAPFKAASAMDAPGVSVPLVDVNDLPKVKPRVVYVPPTPRATSDAASGNVSDPSDAPPAEPSIADPSRGSDAPSSPPRDPSLYENGPVASLPSAP